MANKRVFDTAVPALSVGLEFAKMPTTGYRFFFCTIKNMDVLPGNRISVHLWKSAYELGAEDFVEDTIASGKLVDIGGGSSAFFSIENEQLAGLMLKIDSVLGVSRLRIAVNCGIDEDDDQ